MISFRPALTTTSSDNKEHTLQPVIAGLGDRTKALSDNLLTWRPMEDRFRPAINSKSKTVTDRVSNIMKHSSAKRVYNKIAYETDVLNSYWGFRGIIESEYDLLEPYTLLDVEAIFYNALRRQHSLMFRNGVEWVGEEPDKVDYIHKRCNQFGFMMGQTFETFLKEVLWNLLVCSNCIVAKIRDEEASGGTKSKKNDNKTPVAAYIILPPHTIFPFLDGRGHIEFWRRFYKDGRPYRDYDPEDIIHWKWDVKPGHIYGTPRSIPVRDDIYALRRLEENIELLLVHHLFPLFHVKVGTETQPVDYLPDGASEIDVVRAAIMNMPKEGVFVTDHRVEIEVHGAKGEGLDPMPILEHFKKRVYIGLGISSLDVGESDTSNRSTADNVSQNLKDRVKADLSLFGSMVKMQILRDLFTESSQNWNIQDAVAVVGLAFQEIDVDNQIKLENHAANMFNNHVIDQDEARKRGRMNPLKAEQQKKMHFDKHVAGLENLKTRNQMKLQEAAAEQSTKQAAVSAAATQKTTVKRANSKTGASHTKTVEEPTSHGKKLLSNLVQPANQHGKNLDPHKAKSSADPAILRLIYDELMEARTKLIDSQMLDFITWRTAAAAVIDQHITDPVLNAELKNASALSYDEDLLPILLRVGDDMAYLAQSEEPEVIPA